MGRDEDSVGKQIRLGRHLISLWGDSQNRSCLDKESFWKSLVCVLLNPQLFPYPSAAAVKGKANIQEGKVAL